MILKLVDETVRSGARLEPTCEILDPSARTIQLWQRQGGGEDRRHGPKHEPPNELSAAER